MTKQRSTLTSTLREEKARQTEASSLITTRTKLSSRKLKTSAPSLVWEQEHCLKHFLSSVFSLLWPHSLRLLRCALATETRGPNNSTKKRSQSDPKAQPGDEKSTPQAFLCIVNYFIGNARFLLFFTRPPTKDLQFQRLENQLFLFHFFITFSKMWKIISPDKKLECSGQECVFFDNTGERD